MKIVYCGNDGVAKASFENIATYSYNGNVVVLDREEKWINREGSVPPSYSTYSQRQVAAIIHLAPGEYLERFNDSERD